jgi:hypothetical protein
MKAEFGRPNERPTVSALYSPNSSGGRLLLVARGLRWDQGLV